jgi:hypothetical protein
MYRIFNIALDSDLKLPELEEDHCTSPSISILRRELAIPNEPVWLHHWLSDDGNTDISLAIHGDGFLLRFPALAQFLIARDGSVVEYQRLDDTPADTFRHLLLDQVIPRILGQQGQLVLHTSSVSLQKKGALLFMGESGAGKSTLAARFAEEGADLLTDDCLLVQFNDRPEAVASYGGLRLYPDSLKAAGGRKGVRVSHFSDKRRLSMSLSGTTEPVPITAMYLLEKSGGKEIEISKTRRAADLIALVNQAFLLDVTDKLIIETQFRNLSRLVEHNIPIFRLKFPHDHNRLSSLTTRIVDSLQESGA